MRWNTWIAILATGLVMSCRQQPLTGAEAREALEESSIASQASALLSAGVEVSTDFRIGDAVAEAAQQVRDFVHSQLPCAEVELQDATLTVDYGALPGACTFRGHSFDGQHSIHVASNEERAVVVEHTWTEFNNGAVSVSGTATVTWSAAERSRHVTYELTWTRLRDGRMGVGSGDVVQMPLSGGILEGIEVNGSREWEGDRGAWALDIDGVQMRWLDPVPQSGTWTLQTPFDKSVALAFERIDDDSISVTLSSGRRSFQLQVNRAGAISEE